MNTGQDCRHEFPVDTVCNYCDVMLSAYVRGLKVRVVDLESKIEWWKEQHHKQECRADSADFTCNEAQRGERALYRAIRDYRDLWVRTHETENQPSAEDYIRLGQARGDLFGCVLR